MTTTAELKKNRAARIRDLRVQIAAGEDELERIHEQLLSGTLPHEEYLRKIDQRNNIIMGLEQKYQELARVTADKKSNYERLKYNY